MTSTGSCCRETDLGGEPCELTGHTAKMLPFLVLLVNPVPKHRPLNACTVSSSVSMELLTKAMSSASFKSWTLTSPLSFLLFPVYQGTSKVVQHPHPRLYCILRVLNHGCNNERIKEHVEVDCVSTSSCLTPVVMSNSADIFPYALTTPIVPLYRF